MSILAIAGPVLLRLVEKIFGGGGTGSVKMQWVSKALELLINLAATAGRAKPVLNREDLIPDLEKLLKDEKSKEDWRERGRIVIGGKAYEIEIIGPARD